MLFADEALCSETGQDVTRCDVPLSASGDGYGQREQLSGQASAISGDPDFCRRVVAELPFLRRKVRRWQREAASAEDLVQDTLVQALANQHLWRPGSNLRAWLVTIMRNQFLTSVARSNRSTLALERFAEADVGRAPDSREARLMLRDVERALRRLPNKQRSAILWIGVEGKSYEEAARIMDTSVCAVRCHLARGRDRLRGAVYAGGEASPLATRRGRPPLFGAGPAARTRDSALALAGAD